MVCVETCRRVSIEHGTSPKPQRLEEQKAQHLRMREGVTRALGQPALCAPTAFRNPIPRVEVVVIVVQI